MTTSRRLTDKGIREARAYIDRLREEPERAIDPPVYLLYDSGYAEPFANAPEVDHLPIETRRDAVDYLASLEPRLGSDFIDDWRFWSWMGLFHMGDVLHSQPRRARMSGVYETFVIDPGDSYAKRDSYRHYLWTSWRLYSVFGESMAYLYGLDIMEVGEIVRHIVDSPRIFNSTGIPQLIIRLYTEGERAKRGHQSYPGGIRHLVRVLPQLERTYDVYGMSPNALLSVLPPVFREWDDT